MTYSLNTKNTITKKKLFQHNFYIKKIKKTSHVKYYSIGLCVKGLGFKVSLKKYFLILNIGLSHKVVFKIPSKIKLSKSKDIQVIIFSSKNKKYLFNYIFRIISFKPLNKFREKGLNFIFLS